MRPSLKTKITTSCFDDTCAWYERLFGMTAADRWDGEEGGRGAIFALSGGDGEAFLEIGEGERADYTGLSLHFRADDLEAFRRRLPPGTPYGGPNRRPWGSIYLYLRDPNDIAVIVFETARQEAPARAPSPA